MSLIGSHATVTGGLATGGLGYAQAVGAEVIQVFVSNPRGWAAGPGDQEQDARLRESPIPVFIHATYMINLGSGNPEVAARSANAVGHALRRGAEIGAQGVVVHAGSAAGWPAAARAGPDRGNRPRVNKHCGSSATRSSRCSTSSATTTRTCSSSRWPDRARCCARGPASWPATCPRSTTTPGLGSASTPATCSRRATT